MHRSLAALAGALSALALALLPYPALATAPAAAPTKPAAPLPEGAETRLLRFPDIHGDRIVFTYAGDLWLSPTTGGTAWRLTSHPGIELFAKFSPDGKWLAFTGQYDGDEQVYVMPATGGVPRQLTFYPAVGPLPPRWGYDNQVVGWTPDGKSVVYRSYRAGWDLSDSRLFAVPAAGGLGQPLPMPTAGSGDFSPDGKRMVYSPLARDFRTWKRYQGGWAQDLYLVDLKTLDQENITKTVRTERDPMWIGDRIYFASDRDGTLNLYAYDPATHRTEERTHSRDLDVRWPSRGEDGEIVYELGGALQVFDTRTGASRAVPIAVPSDAVAARPSQVAASGLIEDFGVSPHGERALFSARGDVFSAPVEKGATRNLTHSSGAHDKGASWSPDGSQIAFLSDRSGEEELWVVPQEGGEAVQLTTGGHAQRHRPVWSPDGKRIAFGDKDGKVWVLTLAGRKLVEVADDQSGEVDDYAWAPGGQFLAFSLSDASGLQAVHIWSAADGKLRRLGGPLDNSHTPAWDPRGRYLYFLSARELAPQLSNYEFDYAVNRETGIFAVALRKDIPHPFPPESDEVAVDAAKAKERDEELLSTGAEDKEKPKEKEKKKKEKEASHKEKKEDEEEVVPVKDLRIDFDGLADRVAAVPVEADNFSDLTATGEYLLYVRQGPAYYGRESDKKPELALFALEDREETVLAEEIDGYALAAGGEKALVQKGEVYELLDVNADASEDDAMEVATTGLRVDRVPAEEWAQIFDEVWRRYRDFFYAPNMHGYDWAALRDRYRPLLRYVAHRSDLNYVLGEMIAELNISHAYVEGGDFDQPERPSVALPGARFELDAKAGRYRIAEILHGDNAEERYRAPLTEIGVDARVGDYVLAIDGIELKGDDNPYRLLRHKATQAVELTLNDRPTADGARKVTFHPIDNETPLVYLDWVKKNRERVDALTHGRVGYLHLQDMGNDGIREFIKWYYPQIRKEGLVIDIRGNGGGNVSEMILERLLRPLLSVGVSRTSDRIETYPQTTFYGSLVCVINGTTASDGDQFAAMFRQAKMGPLVGKRTWGGVVGISGHGPLIDGGEVFVPEGASASIEGQWIIEGHGVDPDIEVDNEPKDTVAGKDPQLERAVVEVMKEIEKHPKKLPGRPADPVRTQQR